jgi:hypothetical protein
MENSYGSYFLPKQALLLLLDLRITFGVHTILQRNNQTCPQEFQSREEKELYDWR